MRLILLAVALSLAVPGFADDSGLTKACYPNLQGGEFCSTDGLGKVQVFVFNAGWCPGCNDEMDALPEVFQQYKSQGVIFASLSGEGWARGKKPDTTFLKEWKQRHHVPDGFVVAGKFRDFGAAFGAEGYIPFAVVVDQAGRITKSGSLEGYEISEEVQRLLGHN